MLGRGETRPKTWKREVVGRRGNAFFLCAITEEGKFNRRIKTQKKVNGIGIRTIDGLKRGNAFFLCVITEERKLDRRRINTLMRVDTQSVNEEE